MRTIYIADDGTEFNDESDCWWYEFMNEHSLVHNVAFFNVNDKIIPTPQTDEDYGNTAKVIIPNGAALEQFIGWADVQGWASFVEISEPGTWKWDNEKTEFVREDA